MTEETSGSSDDSEEMAEEIVRAVDDEEKAEDGLTTREREIEEEKEAERLRRARELKKQLRKRELGLIHYRWPAALLIVSGILSIWTEFLVVMNQETRVYGFDTFFDAMVTQGNVFFMFPLVAGIVMIILGVFAYNDPRATYLSVIPGMLMMMSGAYVFFLVTFAVTADPNLVGQISATGTPLSMMIMGFVAMLSIALREKE
ncbi:hypothetical protein EU537_08575 [Candidatus Thorarchaeota archaeon]|nr:MAG: hypothetical protein EU537_08575 [Candidatus Thorarchaeota archaeon]